MLLTQYRAYGTVLESGLLHIMRPQGVFNFLEHVFYIYAYTVGQKDNYAQCGISHMARTGDNIQMILHYNRTVEEPDMSNFIPIELDGKYIIYVGSSKE